MVDTDDLVQDTVVNTLKRLDVFGRYAWSAESTRIKLLKLP